MATIQIFLSAVTAEFRSYRDALRRDLDRPNVTVKVQEDFIATGTETLDKLDAYIRQCDAAIHLVGDMTGALAQAPSVGFVRQRYPDFGKRLPALARFLQPGAPALSYTQWEAWLTLYHRKMLIIAVPEEGASRDERYHLDPAQQAGQREHLARLTVVERYPEIRFANADRLVVEVMRSGLHDVLMSARGVRRPVRAFPPPRDGTRRYLRGYAFDPQLPMTLEPGEKNEIVYSIPSEPLYPGPSGEFVEVIDHDPASGCFYEPVDLEHPDVIKQDGLSPSEANPRFHQQMVYAVAMTTVEAFEQALGRRVLWSPHRDPKTLSTSLVQKLRIYPHALRSPQHYYDPERKALLFGYFPIAADFDPDNIYPEGLVFTCLSPQTIAGDTAFAIIDGMYPALARDDGRDALSLKMAFTDVVSLLHHFSMPGVLRLAIARVGAVRSLRAVLSQLATVLTGGSGRGALRDAMGWFNLEAAVWEPRMPNRTVTARTTDATEHGALVVAAIFDAYVTIVERRVIDVLRGFGRASDALHDSALAAELVEPIQDEAVKAARHVLGMCIRALDYCPPVDVNAGDFLRALVTADYQAMPQDGLGYRTAIVDAFRAHGIHPQGFRSLSVEMLPWNAPSELARRRLQPLIATSLRHWAHRLATLDAISIGQRVDILDEWSAELWQLFDRFLNSLKAGEREALVSELGFAEIMADKSLWIFSPRVTTRTPDSGRAFITVVQRQPRAAAIDKTPARVPADGGSTVVVKCATGEIEHIVRRSGPGR